jgi:hypothetical protein
VRAECFVVAWIESRHFAGARITLMFKKDRDIRGLYVAESDIDRHRGIPPAT